MTNIDINSHKLQLVITLITKNRKIEVLTVRSKFAMSVSFVRLERKLFGRNIIPFSEIILLHDKPFFHIFFLMKNICRE